MKPTIPLFRDIIRQSWQIMWRNKYLWLFGFFVTLLGVEGELHVLLNNTLSVADAPTTLLSLKNLYTTNILGVLVVNFQDFIQRSTIEAILFLLIFLTVTFVGLWLIITSIGALIDSINRHAQGQKGSLTLGFRAGSKYFGRILALTVLSRLVPFLLIATVSMPVILILLIKNTEAGVFLFMLFAFIILILFGLILAWVARYATLYAVIFDQHFWQAMTSGWLLFKKNVLVTVETTILLFVIVFVGPWALFVALAFLSVPFILLGVLALVFNSTAGLVIVIVAAFLVLAPAVALYGSMLMTFQYSIWTLMFRRMIDNKAQSKVLRVVGQAVQYFGKS